MDTAADRIGEHGTFPGVGGLEIFWQAWSPPADPRAVVVLAHGAAEHSGRYAWVGERLAAHGYSLFALDHRGHGRSQGRRALIDRMDHAVADLDALVERARADGLPIYLAGHSVGGTIALAYALRHQDKLAGLVLSAPVAAIAGVSPVTRLAGRVLSLVAPAAGVVGIDATTVSRDRAVVDAYVADPLNYHGKLPARTATELTTTIARFDAELQRLELPLLVMYGSADRLVPPAGSEMIAERAGSGDKTLKRYDGLYHEILNEPEREGVLRDIVVWLDAHVGQESTPG